MSFIISLSFSQSIFENVDSFFNLIPEISGIVECVS